MVHKLNKEATISSKAKRKNSSLAVVSQELEPAREVKKENKISLFDENVFIYRDKMVEKLTNEIKKAKSQQLDFIAVKKKPNYNNTLIHERLAIEELVKKGYGRELKKFTETDEHGLEETASYLCLTW